MTDVDVDARAEAWNGVAMAWDALAGYVDEHSAEATAVVVDRLDIRPGEHVLELAAGPGTLGATFAHLVGPSGAIVLSDLAPTMVEVARRRNAGRANVECAVLDASSIERPEGSFDVVFSRMGLMFAPAPDVALREMHRVLSAGGRLGVMTWAAIEHNPWMTCVGMSAAMAGVVSGGPPVGPGTIFSLGDPSHLADLVGGAGFVDVAVETADVVFRAPDIDTHVNRVGSLAGPLSAALAAATPEQQAAIRRTAGDIAAPFATGSGFELPGRCVLATARRS